LRNKEAALGAEAGFALEVDPQAAAARLSAAAAAVARCRSFTVHPFQKGSGLPAAAGRRNRGPIGGDVAIPRPATGRD
jgi:hypothetical protein